MKLAPLVETLQPHFEPYDYGDARPMVTEADLIAAAAPRGETYTRHFFSLNDDEHDASRDSDDGICVPCDWPNDDIFCRVRTIRRAELMRMGIWEDTTPPHDPTIRL